MIEFNFELEPGKRLYNNIEYIKKEPLISVIVPFYNSKTLNKTNVNGNFMWLFGK